MDMSIEEPIQALKELGRAAPSRFSDLRWGGNMNGAGGSWLSSKMPTNSKNSIRVQALKSVSASIAVFVSSCVAWGGRLAFIIDST